MAMSDRPAERHREIGRVFTHRVQGTRSWDVPSPVAEWTARDVVRHLTAWFPSFLAAGSGIQLPAGPSVDEDPVGAWQAQCDAVQTLLDDPATADLVLSNQHIGEVPLDRAIDQFYTADVFMHTWDLARATGQDDRLDPDFCVRAAGRDGADRAGHAVVRAVRRPGAGEGRRRRADQDARLHRPGPGLDAALTPGPPGRP